MVDGPAMIMPMPHGGPLFYPWHRVLLRQFELALQTAAHDTSITLPYWDWEYSGSNNPFTDDFLGGDGDQAQGGRVTTGPFAYSRGKFAVRIWDEDTGDPGLRREFGDDSTAWLPGLADVSAGLARTPYWPGPNSFERVSEGNLHNPVHRWVGGDMALAASPNDPVFFLHHTYLDLLWERWKTQHPTQAPYKPTQGGRTGLWLRLTERADGLTRKGTWRRIRESRVRLHRSSVKSGGLRSMHSRSGGGLRGGLRRLAALGRLRASRSLVGGCREARAWSPGRRRAR
jgi:hypothetical protein